MDDFDRTILEKTAHRPWPMPAAPWVMTQTWNDLLFAHWPVDGDALRKLVPATFELDRFDGTAWLGVVPFHMTNVAPRFVPALPWVSAFPELNVRTYVTVAGQPGVFFFSLDAGNPLAVLLGGDEREDRSGRDRLYQPSAGGSGCGVQRALPGPG